MDLFYSLVLLIFLAIIVCIHILGMNIRGSPDPLRDPPSCRYLPIPRIQLTMVRKKGNGLFNCCRETDAWSKPPRKYYTK